MTRGIALDQHVGIRNQPQQQLKAGGLFDV